MEQLRDFFKNMMAWVSQMTASQMMLLLGVVAGTIVGAVLVVRWLNDTTYSRLYSELDEGEAGEVVTYLNENHIPYQLKDGGRTVEVPSNDVYRTRIALASEGLPRTGNIGYAIFDKNNLGMTDFLQNLNFRRALEGELTRTIMQLSEISAARVHIVMPKDRLFKQDQREATASVVLKLKGGGLSKHQINGISHLVASSVEGLKPQNIAIVDYHGNLLSSGQEQDLTAGLSASQLDVRKQVEAYLEHKAQSMLDDVLGAGRSVIRLTADLNFAQLEKTSETFDPNTASIRSEERTQTSSAASDKAEEAGESTEDNSSETVITNYELNSVSEHIIEAVGSVDRLSVAVLVDGNYEPVVNETGETEMIYQPRSQEELDRLASIVKSAVGYDVQRNDQLEMVNIAFDRRDMEIDRQALDAIYTRDFYLDIARKVGYVVLFLIIFLYAKRKIKRLFKTLPRFVAPAPMTAKPKPAAESAPASAGAEETERHVDMEHRQPRLADEMQHAAKGQPEEIAKVIKTLMAE